MRNLTIVLILVISTLGPSFVIATVGYSSIQALGRNPSASPKIMTSMIIGEAVPLPTGLQEVVGTENNIGPRPE